MEYPDIKLSVMGCGRWGINHVRTAFSLLGSNLVSVYDVNKAARDRVHSIDPSIPFTIELDDIVSNTELNTVVIATPAETHFQLAKECLGHGKHVLVEKPITLHVDEAKKLIDIANQNNRTLMVGHILLYHPAISMLKELYDKGKIGTLQYIYSNRLNLGSIRSEENILWSFAPHDISILQHLTGSRPTVVHCHGAKFLQKGIEDTTVTYLEYPNNVHAHIFVSWLHPFKEQRLVVIGDKGMFVFEDSLPKDKLKYFPKGFQKTENGFDKFEGDFESIPFENKQALAQEHIHLYECVKNGIKPLTDGYHALEVLEILESASKELHNG